MHSYQIAVKINAPIEDGGGDNVGMGLGPRGVLEKIARGTLLLEVFVGYRAGEAGLAVVVVGLDAAHAADAAEAGGVAAGRSGQVADSGGGGEHGSDQCVEVRAKILIGGEMK